MKKHKKSKNLQKSFFLLLVNWSKIQWDHKADNTQAETYQAKKKKKMKI